MANSTVDGSYRRSELTGIWVPLSGVSHRQDDYDEAGFTALASMQEHHFWYRGRHRFLLAATRRMLGRRSGTQSAIDLGGGCGGWARYLSRHAGQLFGEIALGDSSMRALEMARPFVADTVDRYQVDLLQLAWSSRWDVIFLLDVLEHFAEDEPVLAQIHRALRPGGLLFVTTPALNAFWTYNDEFGGHHQRYSRKDFHRLAHRAGFELLWARYFMFVLSPLLLLSRLRKPRGDMTEQDRRETLLRTHRVPVWPVNEALAFIFASETPIGLWLPFPWGTSILGVFRKR